MRAGWGLGACPTEHQPNPPPALNLPPGPTLAGWRPAGRRAGRSRRTAQLKCGAAWRGCRLPRPRARTRWRGACRWDGAQPWERSRHAWCRNRHVALPPSCSLRSLSASSLPSLARHAVQALQGELAQQSLRLEAVERLHGWQVDQEQVEQRQQAAPHASSAAGAAATSSPPPAAAEGDAPSVEAILGRLTALEDRVGAHLQSIEAARAAAGSALSAGHRSAPVSPLRCGTWTVEEHAERSTYSPPPRSPSRAAQAAAVATAAVYGTTTDSEACCLVGRSGKVAYGARHSTWEYAAEASSPRSPRIQAGGPACPASAGPEYRLAGGSPHSRRSRAEVDAQVAETHAVVAGIQASIAAIKSSLACASTELGARRAQAGLAAQRLEALERAELDRRAVGGGLYGSLVAWGRPAPLQRPANQSSPTPLPAPAGTGGGLQPGVNAGPGAPRARPRGAAGGGHPRRGGRPGGGAERSSGGGCAGLARHAGGWVGGWQTWGLGREARCLMAGWSPPPPALLDSDAPCHCTPEQDAHSLITCHPCHSPRTPRWARSRRSRRGRAAWRPPPAWPTPRRRPCRRRWRACSAACTAAPRWARPRAGPLSGCTDRWLAGDGVLRGATAARARVEKALLRLGYPGSCSWFCLLALTDDGPSSVYRPPTHSDCSGVMAGGRACKVSRRRQRAGGGSAPWRQARALSGGLPVLPCPDPYMPQSSMWRCHLHGEGQPRMAALQHISSSHASPCLFPCHWPDRGSAASGCGSSAWAPPRAGRPQALPLRPRPRPPAPWSSWGPAEWARAPSSTSSWRTSATASAARTPPAPRARARW